MLPRISMQYQIWVELGKVGSFGVLRPPAEKSEKLSVVPSFPIRSAQAIAARTSNALPLGANPEYRKALELRH